MARWLLPRLASSTTSTAVPSPAAAPRAFSLSALALVAIYNSGTPVVAALTTCLMRGERPTWMRAVGALLVISGVLVSPRR